jgi:hypothetical protein
MIRRCLVFDPDERTSDAGQLADSIAELLSDHPLSGQAFCKFAGKLVVATLLDGRVTIARLLEDDPVPAEASRAEPFAQPIVLPPWQIPQDRRSP